MRVVSPFIALMVLASASPLPAQDPSADEQAVRRAIEATGVALNARDYAAAAAVFAENGDLILPRSRRVVGRTAIRAFWEERWSQAPVERRITLTVQSLRFLTPDVAVADCTAEFTVGEPTRDRATYVLVRRGEFWQVAALRVFEAEAQ
ncbi:MAG TPA: SgcJ/EcaC family oxidoreductase [Longimicrobiales bacterium]|nr:SgcJ/EcaC family oxidoreductase [Longimicrobiales bacterium]